ncbi:HD domain-containing protein, partial [Candidatus Gracilibacteria bacterium]|nr:HD domain-containing protein [Candidatus Gracilibacteria bacterium]
KYPDAMRILDITGVSPFGSREMMNPYTNEIDLEDFSNVGRHCVAVAYAASKIADALGVDKIQREEIIKSAILHDGDKRLEVMRKKAKKSGNEVDVYGEEGYKTIESIFSDAGVDSGILTSIQTMGGMTGHNSLKKFLIMKDKKLQLNPERTISEMIVHIADDMTHSSFGIDGEMTQYVSFEKRAALSKFSEKYGFLWQEGFGVSEEGGIQEFKDITELSSITIKHFYDWQNLVFDMICDHIQKLIDPLNSDKSVQFLLDIIYKNTNNTILYISEKVEQSLRVK